MMVNTAINPKIFRAYDIRGNASSDINSNVAFKIGYAFTKKVMSISQLPVIVVGRDGRLTSNELCIALIAGLSAAGASIKYLEIVPTPALYFAGITLDADAAIMLTGSHNPKEDNGFKMSIKNKPFFGDMIQELRTDIENTNWRDIISNLDLTNYHHDLDNVDIKRQYVSRILQDIKVTKDLKIAFDTASGAACEFAKSLCEILPCTTAIINDKIDGNFPAHDPDPTIPKNLEQLIKFVQENDFDFGIGFDGDADRIGVITRKGQILFGDQLLCIYAKEILKTNPNGVIIADIKSSRLFEDEILRYGGRAIIWKTGHSFIKQKILETGALLAGEMSGHIFFNDKYYGYDDALYAACRLIDVVSRGNKTLDEIYENLPSYYSTPEIKISVSDDTKFEIIEKIKQFVIEQKFEFLDIDGVRVSTSNGWWLVRASNTGPSIIVRIEAIDNTDLIEISNYVRKLLKKFEIELP